ncbi:hypothetical protein HDU97_009999 [Phlyctochytrium planicorne]|nr:hypothetical protein HDU97_009999 [Phlyctochytrium planicorne]
MPGGNGPWNWSESDEGFEPVSADAEGLKKRIVKEGSGDPIPKDSQVTVNYTGYIWPDGPKFDSSYDRQRPLKFKVGRGEVIKGWDLGIQTMKVGEHSQLLCPPDFAYGKLGNPPIIPPFSTLLFEVEVVKFDPPQDPISLKISDAKKCKDEGNAFFKAGDFEKAAAEYEWGVKRLEYTWGADPPEAEEAKALKLALNLNLAASTLKTRDFKTAAEASERAVAMDAKSVKGFFRLAQAQAGLSEWDAAYTALARAATLDPSDAAIPKEKIRIEQLQRQVAAKEKTVYKKMFS